MPRVPVNFQAIEAEGVSKFWIKIMYTYYSITYTWLSAKFVIYLKKLDEKSVTYENW